MSQSVEKFRLKKGRKDSLEESMGAFRPNKESMMVEGARLRKSTKPEKKAPKTLTTGV